MFLNSFLVGLGFFVLFLKRKWLFGIFYGLVLFVSHVILVENCLTLPITRQTQLMMALICYVFISDSLNLRMIFILWLSYVLRKKHIFCYFWNDKGTNGRFFRGWRGQSINKIWIEKRKKKKLKLRQTFERIELSIHLFIVTRILSIFVVIQRIDSSLIDKLITDKINVILCLKHLQINSVPRPYVYIYI